MTLSANAARQALENYARFELDVDKSHLSKAQAFVNVLGYAVHLVADYHVPHPADALIDYTFAVLIGNGLNMPEEMREIFGVFSSGRGEGPYYAGNHPGSSGFKHEFQDTSYQVQHAMAAIAIGYQGPHFGPIRPWETLALTLESEPQDVALYKALFPKGEQLNDTNYRDLPRAVADAIGDATVHYVPVHHDPLHRPPHHQPQHTLHYPGHLLERGDVGVEVRAVQKQLNNLGEHLNVDGVYGPNTEAAVRHFQQHDHLAVDGIVGPNTWAALQAHGSDWNLV